MENKEAIEWLKGSVVSYEVDNKGKPNGNITCDLTQEVLDMAISALEKQGWHNARKDPPKRPDRMWDIYCVYTRFDRYGIAKYYAHGKWDGYDEDGDQIEEYEIIAYCNFPKPYTEENNDTDIHN